MDENSWPGFGAFPGAHLTLDWGKDKHKDHENNGEITCKLVMENFQPIS